MKQNISLARTSNMEGKSIERYELFGEMHTGAGTICMLGNNVWAINVTMEPEYSVLAHFITCNLRKMNNRQNKEQKSGTDN